MKSLAGCYNNDAVVYLKAVVALGDDKIVSTNDACDKYTVSQLQFFQRNIDIVLFVTYNEFDSFKFVVYEPIECCYAVSERILFRTDILEYLVYRY